MSQWGFDPLIRFYKLWVFIELDPRHLCFAFLIMTVKGAQLSLSLSYNDFNAIEIFGVYFLIEVKNFQYSWFLLELVCDIVKLRPISINRFPSQRLLSNLINIIRFHESQEIFVQEMSWAIVIHKWIYFLWRFQIWSNQYFVAVSAKCSKSCKSQSSVL